MVFFTCNACGDSLKKNQVEKHYRTQCRRCDVLSCVDCGKEFWGEEYQEHTKCISEDAKYGGKNYKPKPGANKGEQKQLLWIEQVQNAISQTKGNPRLTSLLERLKDYPNIPRKKAKFENFVMNSLRVREQWVIDQVWSLMSDNMPQPAVHISQGMARDSCQHTNGTSKSAAEEDAQDPCSNPVNDVQVKKSKKEKKEERQQKQTKKEKKDKELPDREERKSKKRKRDEEETEEHVAEMYVSSKKAKKKTQKTYTDEAENGDEPSDISTTAKEPAKKLAKRKFSWEDCIIGVLQKADDNELKVKKLKKKVLNEYCGWLGDSNQILEPELRSKFEKKIHHMPNLKIKKERVKLIS